MTEDEIYESVVDFLLDYGFTTYPIDPFSIARELEFRLLPYRYLPNEALLETMLASNDAITASNHWLDPSHTMILYNDEMPLLRQRFSIAHELGHQVLDLPNGNASNEVYVNKFASYFLAPIPIVLRDSAAQAQAVHRDFRVSMECAAIVAERALQLKLSERPPKDYESRLLESCRLDWLGGAYLRSA